MQHVTLPIPLEIKTGALGLMYNSFNLVRVYWKQFYILSHIECCSWTNRY